MGLGYDNLDSDEKIPRSTVSFDGGLMDSAWPMFHHDVRHTGLSPYGKSGNWFKIKWKFDWNGMLFSSPAIDKDGTIYIGSSRAHSLCAINPDGTEKWRYKTGDWIESSPAIAEDGTIYVGSDDGYLYAIYPDGNLRWKFGTGAWVVSSPTIDIDGTIYFGSYDYNIYALYPNGTLKWAYKTDYVVYPSPAIDDGTVYCGSHDGNMYAIYTSNGTLKWKFDTGHWCGGSGAAIGDDGTIYFGDFDGGSLYALYPNGTIKWKLGELGFAMASTPAIDSDGTIYITFAYTNLRGCVYSISPDGSINWKYIIDTKPISASPVIDKNGVIYFGDQDGIFYAFNSDGTIKWKYKTLDEIFPSSAIGEDGSIYIGTHCTSQPDFYTYLYAIEPIYDNPPIKPDIDGQINGKPRNEYTYTAVTSDPDDDDISYYFDWGDGTNSGWSEFLQSGSPINILHSWQHSGTYTIKVKAKDIYNMEGDWESLKVIIPRNSKPLFLNFLERFPMLIQLINRLE